MGTQDQSVSYQTPTESGSWAVDLTRTTASFAVGEFGLRTVRGTVPVTAAALEFEASGRLIRVSAELDPAGVRTGNPKRDRDLQGPTFFATEQHPRWTFRGGPADPFEGGGMINGELTVRDSLDVALEVRPASDGSDDGAADARVMTATADLDRRDAGLRKAPGALISHRIRIKLTVTLRRVG